ncbi:prolyl oligopeptidase family serine peptidase [Oleiagrimonas citrea]|jgi:dipeptidyl aminopeptidase/acylaminoacyl peptidase|uniref:S9 family peptidase n=1 Tax=Oleiagrimonas citrea TaxID=1665687 RepID=A0A846ZMW8_9GAMM|nr:prolyl oligopeptidase family serine peptidase [Oleiagrimonas citrea]NKZ39645.1 S9 family peptidase [Oleiagrimonas citrea]
MQKRFLRLLAACSCCLYFSIGAAWAFPSTATIPLKDFARHPELSDPALSPDGKYLAVRTDDPDGTHHSVVVYRLADMHVISILKMPQYELPLDITWVSATRLVITKGKAMGSIGKPINLGQIIASDYDGKNQRYLYGYDAKGKRAANRARDEGFGTLAGLPDKPNDHFYMDVSLWDNENISSIYNVNAARNTRHLVSDIDQGGMNFLIDKAGQATYAFGVNTQQDFRAFRNIDGHWTPLPDKLVGSHFKPFAYTPDEKKIYAYSSKDGGPYRLIQADADASHPVTLTADPFASFGGSQWSPPPYKLFAVTNLTGIPKAHFLQPQLPSAKLYKALSKAFPGQYVNFIAFSQDGMTLLFSTLSDRNPGSYYLLDRHHNKVRKLFDAAPWIHPQQMSERRSFRFKASDGLMLEGILTLPKGRNPSNLPMILLPHGGPYGIHDDWLFTDGAWDAQMLASRGYLVLQVNFRGSGGRGPAFEQAGYMKWGTRIQQDLIDGVKWAIAKQYADPNRICVYGASFGGYSAMMTVVRAPKLFKCAIGYAGVYDLDMLYHKGDIRYLRSGRNYLHMVIGDDPNALENNSPVAQAGKIDVPVLLVHGKDDTRAPYAGAKEMRDALEKAGKHVEWMAKSGEGHGFYDEQNNIDLFTKMLAFLKTNIGPGAPVAKPAQASN